MPGVPSGKACDACRKQRKKCDQKKPACTRCARLQIPCIGAGQQRYKFQAESHQALAARTRHSHSSTPSSDEQSTPTSLSYVPSNQVTRLTSTFAEKVQFAIDVRYNLTWAYGGYLLEVPRRLGTNKALDAAAIALLSSYQSWITSTYKTTPQALSDYSHALIALRECLDDPVEACSSNTLCAVMLLLLCQGFTSSKVNVHCAGAARILKARSSYYDPGNEFEKILLLSLRGPVLFEGILNRDIKFTRQEWIELVRNDLDETTNHGKQMTCLAKVPELLISGKAAFRNSNEDEIRKIYEETRELYETIKSISSQMRSRYQDAKQKLSSMPHYPEQFSPSTQELFLYALLQRLYALSLFIVLTISSILRSFDPTNLIDLDCESSYFADEMLTLGKEAEVFRPLGSSYMMLFLVVAWIGATDPVKQDQILVLMNDYISDWYRATVTTQELELTARWFDLRDPMVECKTGMVFGDIGE